MKKNNYAVVIITLAVLIVATVLIVKLPSSAPPPEVPVCEHIYSDWENISEAKSFEVGEKKKICQSCGDEISEKINATVALPQLYLEGDMEGVSKTTEVMFSAEYFDSETQLDAYATVKYQGHTSMGFAKKNFTVKFYESESRDKKLRVSFNGWDATNKYCLKANYIDFSGARNLVSSAIWQDVTESREGLDNNIAELEFSGGIDGFPFALFINNEYQGLYTFNIPKDEDTYKIADEENEAMFVINSGSSDAANFKSLLTDEDKEAVYDLEYSYPEGSGWAYDSMDELIDFVMNNDGEDFVGGIENHLDVDASIDYLITAYVLGVTDNFAKNMILLTYDGHTWIPSMYDLDTAGGLIFDGSGYLSADFSLPSIAEDGTVTSGTESLLWERILNCYREEFKARYFELRGEVLDCDNIIERYRDFILSVPSECYEYEGALYPSAPQKDVDQTEQISAFITERTKLLDEIIDKF